MSVAGFSDLRAARRHHPGCCALIAIKQRTGGKSRLAAQLANAQRIALVRHMLAHVLSAVRGATQVRQVFVVSPERDAVPADVPVLADAGRGLNAALLQAQRALLALGCRELLILPADLPTVTAGEIDCLVRAGRRGGVAIAPDARQSGTNALCVVAGVAFNFQFGPDSKRRHVLESRRLGLRPSIVHRPGLAFDVDTPADLRRLERVGSHSGGGREGLMRRSDVPWLSAQQI